MKIEILNGQRLTSIGQWEQFDNIRIENGHILSVDSGDSNFVPERMIDAKGCLVAPGLIDLSVSLREPGANVNGTIDTETAAAAKGGFTAVCSTPDSSPINDSKAVTKLILELSKRENNCRVYPLGALTKSLKGEQLSEYASLKDAGCIALSNAFNPLQSLIVTQRCFEYAKTQDLCVFVNPIEPSLHQGAIHEGKVSTIVGLQGIPHTAETIAVAQLIQLAEATGVRLHLSQLSCAGSVQQVQQAKNAGINVTADVAIQNLLYTDQTTESFDGLFHCQPPLREECDRLALIAGIKSGAIDVITSAHRPCEAAAKLMPFAETAPGMSTIELVLPFAQQLVKHSDIPLSTFIKSMTSNAAAILDLPNPTVERGAIADLVIFDPIIEFTLAAENLISKGKNSPYLGQELIGAVRATINQGRISYALNPESQT